MRKKSGGVRARLPAVIPLVVLLTTAWISTSCDIVYGFTFGTMGTICQDNINDRQSHRNFLFDITRSHVVRGSQYQRLQKPSSFSRLSMSGWSSGDEIEGIDRFKSCVPYLLPLLDGEIFGRYIYERIPPLGFLDSLFIGPLFSTYSSFPLLGILVFVSLTLGTRGNTDINWNVRYNAQQACLIDVALIVPELIASCFEGEDIPRYLAEPCMNFVWYTYMSMVLYCIYSNIVLKKRPDQIPWISGYATALTGPI